MKALLNVGLVLGTFVLQSQLTSGAPSSHQITFSTPDEVSLYDSLRIKLSSLIPGRDTRELDFSRYTVSPEIAHAFPFVRVTPI